MPDPATRSRSIPTDDVPVLVEVTEDLFLNMKYQTAAPMIARSSTIQSHSIPLLDAAGAEPGVAVWAVAGATVSSDVAIANWS